MYQKLQTEADYRVLAHAFSNSTERCSANSLFSKTNAILCKRNANWFSWIIDILTWSHVQVEFNCSLHSAHTHITHRQHLFKVVLGMEDDDWWMWNCIVNEATLFVDSRSLSISAMYCNTKSFIDKNAFIEAISVISFSHFVGAYQIKWKSFE